MKIEASDEVLKHDAILDEEGPDFCCDEYRSG